MPFLFAWFEWLQNSPMGTGVRESVWIYPGLVTLHVLGLSISVGLIAIFDLRLIGYGISLTPVSDLARQLTPWATVGFTCMVVSGVLLLGSEAVDCYNSPAFWIKLGLLALAALNALTFYFTVYRNVAAWDQMSVTPTGARIAGWASLVLWVAIIFAGRSIAYTF
jgi:hypothetical protein